MDTQEQLSEILIDEHDYYEILQVEAGASQDDIRSAYKRLAFLYHPDHSTQPDANERMLKLNEAFAILGSPEKRSLYDLERQTQEIRVQVTVVEPVPPEPQPRREPGRLEKQWEAFWAALSKRIILLSARVRDPLKVLYYLFGAILLLFVWSMATGKINVIALVAILLAAVWLILSVIFKMKRPSASK